MLSEIGEVLGTLCSRLLSTLDFCGLLTANAEGRSLVIGGVLGFACHPHPRCG